MPFACENAQHACVILATKAQILGYKIYRERDLKYEIFEICNNIDPKPKLE